MIQALALHLTISCFTRAVAANYSDYTMKSARVQPSFIFPASTFYRWDGQGYGEKCT